jgi:hypothetical protein
MRDLEVLLAMGAGARKTSKDQYCSKRKKDNYSGKLLSSAMIESNPGVTSWVTLYAGLPGIYCLCFLPIKMARHQG